MATDTHRPWALRRGLWVCGDISAYDTTRPRIPPAQAQAQVVDFANLEFFVESRDSASEDAFGPNKSEKGVAMDVDIGDDGDAAR